MGRNLGRNKSMYIVYPKRFVIKGVPKVNSDKADEDFYFVSCMKELLAFFKEDSLYDYNYLCSISGASFSFLWDRSNWNPLDDITALGCKWSEPIDRVFAAVGYEYEIIKNDNSKACKDMMISKIKYSLYIEKKPLLAWGVLNKEPICCIITGYDDSGETLIGWHYRQFSQGLCNEYDYGGYFRKTGWFCHTSQILLVGNRYNKPDFLEITKQTMQYGSNMILKEKNILGYFCGISAYDAWIEDMNDEIAFLDDINTLKLRTGCIYRTCEVAAEVYWNGMDFMKAISTWHDLMAEDALLAAADFVAQTDNMYKIWYLIGALQDESVRIKQLKEKEVRREIVSILEEAKRRDVMAAKNIQRGLKKIKIMKKKYYLKPEE